MASNFYASREMAEPMLDINSRSAALRANAEAMRRELLGLGIVQAIFWFPFGLMYFFLSRQPMKRGRQAVGVALTLFILTFFLFQGLYAFVVSEHYIWLAGVLPLFVIQLLTSLNTIMLGINLQYLDVQIAIVDADGKV